MDGARSPAPGAAPQHTAAPRPHIPAVPAAHAAGTVPVAWTMPVARAMPTPGAVMIPACTQHRMRRLSNWAGRRWALQENADAAAVRPCGELHTTDCEVAVLSHERVDGLAHVVLGSVNDDGLVALHFHGLLFAHRAVAEANRELHQAPIQRNILRHVRVNIEAGGAAKLAVPLRPLGNNPEPLLPRDVQGDLATAAQRLVLRAGAGQ
mmetsp:Transcript_108602/g.150164  ORF Transcript_108602/g.150164 Transcript_108602/m.150164 type:complete len:208 (+) Transcript_108602:275-898(+)